MKTEVYDLNFCPTNERNGSYGGRAGEKEGITWNGGYWIVKYPKSTKGMRGELTSYTTSPLSEYIGSHVYQILGIPVHETILGIRNEKLVVACKDFCIKEGSLREIRTLKNVYNPELSKQLEINITSTSASHCISLEDMMIHFKYNPILSQVHDIQKRFWQQFIVDILINNNDRNNGNWGILYSENSYQLAPVFDNGASFSNKAPDRKLELILTDEKKMQQSILDCKTIYAENGKQLYAKDILNIDNKELLKAAHELVPLIEKNMDAICDFVQGIPEKVGNICVCSKVRKEFYLSSMKMKFEQFLQPIYEKYIPREKKKAGIEIDR